MPLKVYTKVTHRGPGAVHVKTYVKLGKPRTQEETDKDNENVIKEVEKQREQEANKENA